MSKIQTYNDGEGVTTVVWMDRDFAPVEPGSDDAAYVKMIASTGEMSFYHVNQEREAAEWNEADHPRDEDGQFATVYHGTIEGHIESIKAEGISSKYSGAIWPKESKPEHIYMAGTRAGAEEWAAKAAFYSQGTGAVPTVIEVAVPKSVIESFERDQHFGDDPSTPNYQFKGSIKPEWITGIYTLKKKHYDKGEDYWDYESGTEDERASKWRKRKLASGEDVVILYIPLALKVKDKEE